MEAGNKVKNADPESSRLQPDFQFDSQSKENKQNKKRKPIKMWTQEEDKILFEVGREFDFRHWRKISERLEGRTAIQCSARYKRIKPGMVKGSWGIREDEKLINYVKRFGKNCSLISQYMPTRT